MGGPAGQGLFFQTSNSALYFAILFQWDSSLAKWVYHEDVKEKVETLVAEKNGALATGGKKDTDKYCQTPHGSGTPSSNDGPENAENNVNAASADSEGERQELRRSKRPRKTRVQKRFLGNEFCETKHRCKLKSNTEEVIVFKEFWR